MTSEDAVGIVVILRLATTWSNRTRFRRWNRGRHDWRRDNWIAAKVDVVWLLKDL